MTDEREHPAFDIQVSFHISGRKLTDYLLNPEHPGGASKARFFSGHGFRRDRPDELASAFLQHSTFPSVRKTTPYGLRLVITAPLITPNGTRPVVTSVWQIPPGDAVATFITAYPARSTAMPG